MPRRAGTTSAKPTGLVGHWKFDELGGVAIDASGCGNHGHIVGADRVNGKINGALDFNGTSDYVNCGNAINIKPGTGDFSFLSWINMEVAQAQSIISDMVGAFSEGWRVLPFFAAHDDGKLTVFIEASNGQRKNYQITTGIITAGTYYQVGFTWKNSTDTLKLYVNGIERNTSKTTDDDLTGDDCSNANNLTIGLSDDATDVFFNGIIDDTKTYNTTLFDSDILKIYNDES